MKPLVLSLFLTFALLSMNAWAQGSSGFHATLGIPTSDFRDAVPGIMFPEIAWTTIFPIRQSPIHLGFSATYGLYGTRLERRRDLYAGQTDRMWLRRNNNTLNLMGVFRFYPETYTKVQPFFEGQLGATYLFTRYKIRESLLTEPIEEGLDLGAWAMTYKIGGGIKWPLKDWELGYYEFKISYHDNAPIDFLRKGDTTFNPDICEGEFTYRIQRSAFQLIQPSFGVFFYIN